MISTCSEQVGQPRQIVDGVVVAAKACSLGAAIEGPTYVARARFSFGSESEWGIAVFAPGSRAEYVDGEFVLKTPDATTPLRFRTCASQEGVHFTTWRGKRRAWHEYVYLGIDLEANCTDKDVGE